MFVDETNPTSSNQYFCIAGLIIERGKYEDSITMQVNELKTKIFSTTDVIFHYSEIKSRRNSFECLNNGEKRTMFHEGLSKIYANNPFTIMAVYFNKSHMQKLYKGCAISDYDVAFKYLLENFVHFLRSNNGEGMVIVESRVFNQNARLQNTFYNYLNSGSDLYDGETVSNTLKCLGFIVKNENCIGLQLVDFIPSIILRNVYNDSIKESGSIDVKPQKDYYNLGRIIKSKVYYKGTGYYDILGVKNIFGK